MRLCCSSNVWVGVVMNHHNTPAKHATSLILNRAGQFFKCVVIGTCIDCGASRQEVNKQNAFSVPKHCAHDLPSWSSLLEFRLCWQWSVPPLHELLLQFRGFMWHPCLIPCDYMGQEVFAFLTVSCLSPTYWPQQQTVGRSADHAHFCIFIKQSHPSPYHWTTHGMFSIHVTKLMMSFSRFMFFAFKKQITEHISHAVGFSIFLNIINTQHDV